MPIEQTGIILSLVEGNVEEYLMIKRLCNLDIAYVLIVGTDP